jgi:hypothetical protein
VRGDGYGSDTGLAGDGNGSAAATKRSEHWGRHVAAAPTLAALLITSVCVVKWIPVEQSYGVHLKIELTADGHDVYGELLFEIDQWQKGPWNTAAANISIADGESIAIDYRYKPVNPEVRFKLWAAVVDADPNSIRPGQGLDAYNRFEVARLIPTC